MTHPTSFQPGLDAELSRWEAEIKKRPKQAPLRFSYALALHGANDPAGAVEQASLALSLDPRSKDAARLLASLLQQYEINADIDINPRGLTAAFAFPDVDRQALSVAAIRYPKTQPTLHGILATGDAEGWDAAATALLSKAGRGLIKDRLFRSALTHGYNTDPAVEFLLTVVRRHLLLSIDRDRLRDRDLYEFVCTLIRQCIVNEYVFPIAEDEHRVLEALDRERNADDLLFAALYRPSHDVVSLEADPRLFRNLAPRALRNVLQAEWEDRKDETQRAQSLPRMAEITNDVSQQVEQQYLEDPYPRWLSLQPPAKGIIRNMLAAFFIPDELGFFDDPFNVLIAGCGTGQQAVGSALAYGPNADVLAIDLSRRSLAYAARMSERYDAGNLHFAQADILGLADSTDSFDIIECVGVLHHMAQPYDAWRILVDRLKPGGLMQIGLYSAVSRQNFQALRNDPAFPGPDADDDALRSFRSAIMQRAPGQPGTELLISRDFYVKSGFRDLALHVSEQHCTLPEIEAFLDANGLTFHGFRMAQHIRADFAEAYIDDDMPGRLANWDVYERNNPRTFDGMYVFWCRKR